MKARKFNLLTTENLIKDLFFRCRFYAQMWITLSPGIGWFITTSLHFAAPFFRLSPVTKIERIMISYLLLRNNKETGPYGLEELVKMGLKAYDLVWVNGKSAAWRYPGEINELKPFAPDVVEQPFDRFFKKPQPAQELLVNPIPTEKNDPEPVYTPKKSVFVTMPGQQKNVKPVVPQTVTAKPKQVQPSYDAYQQYLPKTDVETIVTVNEAQTITIKENAATATAEIKYSKPLDEIKEMYVRTLQDRKQRIASKAVLIKTLKKVGVVVAIAGIGVLIGFTMKGKAPANPVAINQSSIPVTAIVDPEVAEQPTVGTTSDNAIQPQNDIDISSTTGRQIEETKPADREAQLMTHNQVTQSVLAKPTPKQSLMVDEPVKQVPVKKQLTGDEVSPGVDLNSNTGERSRKVREANDNEVVAANNDEEVTADHSKPNAVMNTGLSRQVSVKANEYKKVAFGGIRDLQLTVYNDSKFVLDNVVVEVNYLKPSELPLKTELVTFRSVSPGGSSTIRVPDTNRGIKVEYKIKNILSTQASKENL